MEEPEGTRMQVVKGFSELVYPGIHEALPMPRKDVDLYWPKWLGEHWRCAFHVDDFPAVIINLWPSGTCQFIMLESSGVTKDSFKTTFPQQPPERNKDFAKFYFEEIATHFTDKIVKHLKEATKRG